MGMLIRRHRDRHSEDATAKPARSRKRSRKAPEQVDPPKAPATEPDNGSGGELVTPGTGSSTDADQLTESGSDDKGE